MSKILYIIPARGGSKGLPGKNIKQLAGKPLIKYTIEVAQALAANNDICVSTDSLEIKSVVESAGLPLPFLRPVELATDDAGTYEVLIHALNFYKSKGVEYEKLVLLQPTSPFRQVWHVKEAIELWKEGIEMVVSVKETKSNPYYLLFEENKDGFLENSKKANFTKRQDCPVVYEYNGAVYVIDVKTLLQKPISAFTRKLKYVMSESSSLDIDTEFDWKLAEYLLLSEENEK